MRILLIYLACCLWVFCGNYHAAPNISQWDKIRLDKLEKQLLENNNIVSEDLQGIFPIYKFPKGWYLSILARCAPDQNLMELEQNGVLFKAPIGGLLSLKVPITKIKDIQGFDCLTYIQIAGKINPYLDKAIIDLHADSVHHAIGLPQSYSGKNVLIGVTDWGFDYTHPVFYDTLLAQYRIVAAWDQFKISGPAPNGFGYGTAYNSTEELLAAKGDTANIYSYGTHGTHVAGIAGGAGADTPYRGVAYDAEFLFVTFLIDEGAVLDAWQWMYQKALVANKRLVINMSWGLYHFGTLDGTSLLSQAISAFSNLGVVFVNSGGNNGNVNFHLKKTFNDDQLKSRIEFYDYAANPNMWGQSIHAWGEVNQNFENGIIVTNSANVTLIESPYYNTASTPNYIDTFLVVNQDTIHYNITADAAHPLNGRPQMRLRVKNTNPNLRVQLKSHALSGEVNYWNVTELSNNVGNWGMAFLSAGNGTTPGDNQNGISEPSCADDVISVAAYATQYATSSGSLVGGALATFSSKGPRYNGAMKPDIAAPGVAIISAISSLTDGNYTTVASTQFHDSTYRFAKFSGTSMASPMVAGVAALILEANPYLSSNQVKQIIKQTARQDDYTGIIPSIGSPLWGAGKINAYAAVQMAIQTIGLQQIDCPKDWSIFPNPAQQKLNFSKLDLPKYGQIINPEGKCEWLEIIDGAMEVGNLKPGLYVVRLVVNGKIQQSSFIKI